MIATVLPLHTIIQVAFIIQIERLKYGQVYSGETTLRSF